MKVQRKYLLVLTAILTGIAIWMIPSMYGIIFPPDEYGYWANAAVMLGKNWQEVNGLNPYYAYGYSFILMPLLGLAGSVTNAYRLAIFLNMIFIFLHGCLLWKISEKLFSKEEDRRFWACLCGALYPSLLVYMQYTLSESLLSLSFLFVVWRFWCYLEKQNMQQTVWLAAAVSGMYLIHMRTIGICLAMVGSMYVLCRKSRKRQFAVFFTVLLVGIGGAEIGKHFLKLQLYGSGGSPLAAFNDYAGLLPKLQSLCSIEGIGKLLAGMAGKLFYLGHTTFGLFYFALYFLGKKWKENTRERGWYGFLLAAVFLNFGVAALGMMASSRVDGILYGRYNETVVPILIVCGLMEVRRQDKLFEKGIAIAAAHGFLLGAVSLYIGRMRISTYLPDFAIGIAWAAGQKPESIRQILLRPYLTGLTGMTLFLFLIWLEQKKKRYSYAAVCLSITFLVISAVISIQNIRPHQADNLGDRQIAEHIREMKQEEQERSVILLHTEWNEYADMLQFFLPEESVRVILENDAKLGQLKERDLVLTYREDEREEALGLIYRMREQSWHFNLHYNP